MIEGIKQYIRQRYSRLIIASVTPDEVKAMYAELKLMNWYVNGEYERYFDADHGLYNEPHGLFNEHGDPVILVATPYVDDTESRIAIVSAAFSGSFRNTPTVAAHPSIQHFENHVNKVWEKELERLGLRGDY